MDDQVTELLASEANPNKWTPRLQPSTTYTPFEVSFEVVTKNESMQLNDFKLSSPCVINSPVQSKFTSIQTPNFESNRLHNNWEEKRTNETHYPKNNASNLLSTFETINLRLNQLQILSQQPASENAIKTYPESNNSFVKNSYERYQYDGLFNPYDVDLQKKLNQILIIEGKKRGTIFLLSHKLGKIFTKIRQFIFYGSKC